MSKRAFSETATPFGVVKFRKLLWAGSFSQLAQFFMGFLGSALAGNLLGETELSGVSLLLPILTGLSFVAALFGVGTGITYALEQGRGNVRRAREYFSQGFWSVLVVGTFLSVGFLFLHPRLLAFLNPSAPVAAAALPYCRLLSAVPLVELLSVFLLNACFADGDDRLCYAAYAAQLTVNLSVTYAALRLGFGTAGCAFGTLVGFASSAVVLSFHFVRKANSFRLVRHFRLADSLRIVRTVFGDSCWLLFQGILILILDWLVVARYGSELLPVLAVVAATLGLLEIFGGVGAAVQPIVSVYVGERNTFTARQVMTAAMRISAVEGLLATLLFLLAPRLVILLAGVSDPTLVATASRAVRLLSPGFVALALFNLLNGYYIIVGHGGFATALSALAWIGAPLVSILAFGWLGVDGLWLALGLGPLLAALVASGYVLRVHGREMFPLLLPRNRDGAIRQWTLPIEPTEITEVSRSVAEALEKDCVGDEHLRLRVRLLIEDALMVVREHNGRSHVLGEVTLDLNEGATLTLRDDGEIFDLTDADAQLGSLRAYVLCTVLAQHQRRENLIATGFNRSVFRLDAAGR